MPTHQLQAGYKKADPEEICLFAQTNFRNQMRRFGIKTDDRRRHMYVIGKTGMGKTTMMENMVLHDVYKGHGVGIVDPHGDFAEKIIDYIPSSRMNDVVYLNPADVAYPIGFNILEAQSDEQKHLIAAGLMGNFKKIWPDVWSSRMEYILNNTILALLDYPGSTLLGINRLLGDKEYRRKVVKKLHDPVIKSFWQNEFANYNDRYQQEAVAPIQNKIGQFLSASVIRNMVAQVKSTINIREIMDSGKIFIMNLSKGRIGEDNSRLLGGMLINKIQLSAMERVDTPEAERKDFFLYVDEFQNFATPSFANILSEARKYRLSLIMAHQYIMQLDEIVADAVFGNVGTIVTFRVGGADSETLTKEFTPTFTEEDVVNLAKYDVILKLMIDGVASQPFSAKTMPPIGKPTGSGEKVIRVSRERYAKQRDVIEQKILRWSGLGELHEDEDGEGDIDDEDDELDENPKPAKDPAPPKPDRAEQKQDKPVSLRDLLPKEDREALMQAAGLQKPETKQTEKPLASFSQSPQSGHKAPESKSRVEFKSDPGRLDNQTSVSSQEPKPQGPAMSERLPQGRQEAKSQQQNFQNPQPQGEEKKKRKRKRKRKRKQGQGAGEQSPQQGVQGSPELRAEDHGGSGPRENNHSDQKQNLKPLKIDSGNTDGVFAPNHGAQPSQANIQKIQADQIISFD